MCIQWTQDKYSVVITRQSNPPILQFNSQCSVNVCLPVSVIIAGAHILAFLASEPTLNL